MNALIVGAGAVGQVYGSHLQRGGAKVSFLVKEKYRAALEGGVDLYPLNDPAYRASPLRFSDYRLLTSDEQVASETWDQVYLTVSSTAVRGPWLGPLLKAIGKATVVSFQPGLEDRRYLLQWMPEEQLVAGTLTLISYQAPLPGETRFPRPGMAYWFPPMSASPFSGPSSRVKPVVDALNAGKLPAKIIADVPSQVAFPNAMLMPVLLGLESAGWSFAAFKSGEQLALAAKGAREAMEIAARQQKKPIPAPLKLVSPFALRALFFVAPRVIPLDLETYLKVHFTKVNDQTRFFVERFVTLAREQQQGSATLEKLLAQTAPAPTK